MTSKKDIYDQAVKKGFPFAIGYCDKQELVKYIEDSSTFISTQDLKDQIRQVGFHDNIDMLTRNEIQDNLEMFKFLELTFQRDGKDYPQFHSIDDIKHYIENYEIISEMSDDEYEYDEIYSDSLLGIDTKLKTYYTKMQFFNRKIFEFDIYNIVRNRKTDILSFMVIVLQSKQYEMENIFYAIKNDIRTKYNLFGEKCIYGYSLKAPYEELDEEIEEIIMKRIDNRKEYLVVKYDTLNKKFPEIITQKIFEYL